jgi:hypothetical protein
MAKVERVVTLESSSGSTAVIGTDVPAVAFYTDDQAAMLLARYLATPGELRVITNEHRCGVKIPRTDAEIAACATFPFPLTSHEHFVVNDVVSIEGPDGKGRYTAFTNEGDRCIGYRPALLARLREAGPRAPE